MMIFPRALPDTEAARSAVGGVPLDAERFVRGKSGPVSERLVQLQYYPAVLDVVNREGWVC
jgi:hypothetical protein